MSKKGPNRSQLLIGGGIVLALILLWVRQVKSPGGSGDSLASIELAQRLKELQKLLFGEPPATTTPASRGHIWPDVTPWPIPVWDTDPQSDTGPDTDPPWPFPSPLPTDPPEPFPGPSLTRVGGPGRGSRNYGMWSIPIGSVMTSGRRGDA